VCVYVAVASEKKEREREISNTTVLVLVLQSLFVSFFVFLVSEKRIITIALLVCFVLFVVSKSSSNSREEGEVAVNCCVTDRPTDSYSSRHKKSSSFEDFFCSFAAFWKTF
jgi:Ca2+/Na+ antiporter